VVDARPREVAHPPAPRSVPVLPLLLLPNAGEHRVERSDQLESPSPDGHVGAPHKGRVAVLRPEVERGDRSALPATRARSPTLQPRANGPAEHVVLWRADGAGEQGREPARRRLHVIVDEDDQLAARFGGSGVPFRVGAGTIRDPDQPRTVARGHCGRRRILVIGHHEYLGALTRGLRLHGRKRHVEIGRPPACRDDDRCDWDLDHKAAVCRTRAQPARNSRRCSASCRAKLPTKRGL